MGVTEVECRGIMDARHSCIQWTGIDTVITLAQPFLGGDEATGNRVDCTAGINFLRAALASSDALYVIPTPMWTDPHGLLCRVARNMDTYVWCTSGSQGPYSSHDNTAHHRHWPWNKARPLSPAVATFFQRTQASIGTPASPASCFHLPLASRES